MAFWPRQVCLIEKVKDYLLNRSLILQFRRSDGLLRKIFEQKLMNLLWLKKKTNPNKLFHWIISIVFFIE